MGEHIVTLFVKKRFFSSDSSRQRVYVFTNMSNYSLKHVYIVFIFIISNKQTLCGFLGPKKYAKCNENIVLRNN